MSGGVDSSVAALLLKNRGYEVIGVTLSIWEESEIKIKSYRGCCSLEAVNDAKRVAAKLGIPHYTLNFQKEFQESVIDYFVKEYSRGRTPNPCLKCNQIIKFELLLKKALGLGADYLATGHYARIEYDKKRGVFLLKKGVDKKKDQSYVLYMLNQETLPLILFPLGELTKDEVRKIAKEAGLPTAMKSESQEICFIPDNDYPAFLQKRLPQIAPGPIVDTEGNVIGTHQGIIHYTIGQRRGLGIPFGKPLYVVDIIPEKNMIVVGEEKHLYSQIFFLEEVNWVEKKPSQAFRAQVKIRYRSPEKEATIFPEEEVKVVFSQPQKAVTPGQAGVIYQGEVVVGGGIIKEVVRNLA